MNTLRTNKPSGISRQGLRMWGLLCIVLGTVGQSVFQIAMLGVNSSSAEDLLTMMENSDNLTKATIAIVLQFVLGCAIPIFTYLLVEGFQHTSSFKNYILRVAGVAVLSEIPFNLAMSGKWLDFGSRNPVFGMVLALIVLYLLRYYAGTSIKNILIKILVVVVAILWVEMLRIHDAAPVVVMAVFLWLSRKKKLLQIFGGCAVMFVCTIFSPTYLMAPMMFLVVHFYNQEQGEENKILNYLAYPAILLAVGLLAKYVL